MSNTLLNDLSKNLQRKTDYRCCKNGADKPISDIWPIIGASLIVMQCKETLVKLRLSIDFPQLFALHEFKSRNL